MHYPYRPYSLAALVLALLGLAGGLAACLPARASPTPEALKLALPRLEQNALVYVAAEEGYFARNGLEVDQRDCDTGVATLDALVRGDADLAVAAEYPFVAAVLQGKSVSVIATIGQFENDYVVARRDRGIAGPDDLRGKRIGLPRGTIVEFYLARLLELRGIQIGDITLVDLAPDRLAGALEAGQVDAVVAWQPNVARMQRSSDVLVFPVQSGQAVFGVLVARQDWLAAHGPETERVLRALAQAEDYAAREPESARSIVRRRLDYDPAYLTAVWPKHDFSLTLDQPLIIAMKDEAQWMIRNGLAAGQELPDLEAHVDARMLQAVKPGAVRLIP